MSENNEVGALDEVNIDDFTASSDELLENPEEETPDEMEEQEPPKITDPEWHDYVMAQFEPDELDESGAPLVHGLRRVGSILLGPVIASVSKVVQPPRLLEGFEKLGFLQPAVVEHQIQIIYCRDDFGEPMKGKVMTFGDAADVYHGNTDMDFARHPTAMAATRAEARAWRKALQLNRVISSEERTFVPMAEAGIDGKMTSEQVNVMDIMGRRIGIDVWKYINSGERKFKNLEEVPFGVAVKMVEHLSSLQNKSDSSTIEKFGGYKANWKKGKEGKK